MGQAYIQLLSKNGEKIPAYICTDQWYVIDRHGLCAVKQTERVTSDFYSWVKYSPRIGGDKEHTFLVPKKS